MSALMAPLESKAAGLLLQATAAGLELRRVGDRLLFRTSTIHPDFVPQLQAAKKDLLALLDEGVQARRDAFAQLLAGTPAPRVPALVFRLGTPYQRGFCFSCGDVLPEPRYGRCWRCSLAWRLAAHVSSIGITPIDEAKVVG